MLLQIRWSTGIECDTPFPFSFLSTPSAFWSWADLRPRKELGGSLVGFAVRKSPVAPGTCFNKMPCCPFKFLSKNRDKSLGGMAELA